MIVKGNMFRVLRRQMGINASAITDRVSALRSADNFQYRVMSSNTLYKLETDNKIIPPFVVEILIQLGNISHEYFDELYTSVYDQMDELYSDLKGMFQPSGPERKKKAEKRKQPLYPFDRI